MVFLYLLALGHSLATEREWISTCLPCRTTYWNRPKLLAGSDYYFLRWAPRSSFFPVFDFKLHKYYDYKQCLLVSLLPNTCAIGRDASRVGYTETWIFEKRRNAYCLNVICLRFLYALLLWNISNARSHSDPLVIMNVFVVVVFNYWYVSIFRGWHKAFPFISYMKMKS